jgi:hypothetical protein
MMAPLRCGRSEPEVRRGGGSSEVEAESGPGGRARWRPSSEVKVESEPWGRAMRRSSSEVEVESEPWGRARRRSSSEVEVESEPWGRARWSFLWRPRLDLATVSLTLAGGTAVGAGQAALFSCQVGQWSGEMTAATLRPCRLRSARQDKVSVDLCIECSGDTVGWRSDPAKVASPRSLPELGLGRVEGASVA